MVERRSGNKLNCLLNPTTIAIVGASNNVQSWGGRVFQYLVDYNYEGKIYPINPKYSELRGVKCYPSIADIRDSIDVMVMAIPIPAVFNVIEQVASANIIVKNGIVITAGFSERGESAKQDELLRLASRAGMRILGPNCLGVINAHSRAVLSSTQALLSGRLSAGSISIISHSGAFAGTMLSQFEDRGLGVKYVVSTGNEADYELADFVDYFCEDEDTKIIALFVEGIGDGDRFIASLRKIQASGKVGIVLKVGRTEIAAGIARSHTAKLTGSDQGFDAIFKKYGIIRVDTIEEMTDTASLFAKYGKSVQDKVFVLSPSGGACGILADKCFEIGLDLGTFSSEEQAEIDAQVQIAAAKNPLDFGSSREKSIADTFGKSLDIIEQIPQCGAIVAALTTFPGIERVAVELVQKASSQQKPVILVNSAGGAGKKAGELALAANIPVYTSTFDALKSLKNWLSYRYVVRNQVVPSEAAGRKRVAEVLRRKILAKEFVLTEYESKDLLKEYGIPVTAEYLVQSVEEAAQVAARLKYPLVLKVVSPEIVHKTEVGGVITDIQGIDELKAAYKQIITNVKEAAPHAVVSGLLVQEMIVGGFEVFAGVNRAKPFGHLIAFGLGGIYIEALNDAASRMLPLDEGEVFDMVEEVKIAKILRGMRGQPSFDRAAIAALLQNLSHFVTDFKEYIAEIDINPFVVFEQGKGVRVMDAVIVLQNKETSGEVQDSERSVCSGGN